MFWLFKDMWSFKLENLILYIFINLLQILRVEFLKYIFQELSNFHLFAHCIHSYMTTMFCKYSLCAGASSIKFEIMWLIYHCPVYIYFSSIPDLCFR